MGAGRSGTTALATFLGNNRNILTVGEMHQFFEHINEQKHCSCENTLESCEVWSKVLEKLPKDYISNAKEYKIFCEKFEYHSAVPKYLLNKFSEDELERYKTINETIFETISKEYNAKYILDSAKYIGRYIGLSKSKKLNLKTILLIRDVRGVINSFSKAVQSPRGTMSTIIYWLIVNSVVEFLYRISKKESMIKIKYENLIEDPISEFSRLEEFLNLDLSDIKNKIRYNDSFDIPHIIGGNRITKEKQIKFKKDVCWREKYSSSKKLFYYFLASPIMILNRFKV